MNFTEREVNAFNGIVDKCLLGVESNVLNEGSLDDDDKNRAAGCIIVINGKLLLQQRSLDSDEGGTWACFGGSCKIGETFLGGMERECQEEIGINPKDLKNVDLVGDQKSGDFTYRTFIAHLKPEAIHTLRKDHESIDYSLFGFDKVMALNLHPKFRETMIDHKDKIMDYIKMSKEGLGDKKIKVERSFLNECIIDVSKRGPVSKFING